METDCIVHDKICQVGAVTFIAEVSNNDSHYTNYISYNTVHKIRYATRHDTTSHNAETDVAWYNVT
jgi:hypothetical protein